MERRPAGTPACIRDPENEGRRVRVVGWELKLRLLEYDLTRKEVTGAWAFGEGQKNRVVKTWLVPSSMYLSDCLPLADGAHVQQC